MATGLGPAPLGPSRAVLKDAERSAKWLKVWFLTQGLLSRSIPHVCTSMCKSAFYHGNKVLRYHPTKVYIEVRTMQVETKRSDISIGIPY